MPGTTRVPGSAEIRRELDLVLSSVVFRGSKRCQDFLRYVATKSLEGAAETLKERTLAVEVFGRNTSSDLADDSIVRVGAREVRKRLAQYYVTAGAADPVRIDLPAGSYVPVFHLLKEDEAGLASAIPEPVAAPPLAPVTIPAAHPSYWRAALPWLGVAVAAAASFALIWRLLGPRFTDFEKFWAPVFRSSVPVILVMPHPIVYHPSSHANRLDLERNGRPELPVQRPIAVPPASLDGSDLVPVLDQYVGFGDTVAALRLSTLLTQHGHVPGLRLASKVEFNDLRDSIPILIGAFTNRWTAEVTRNLRFRFGYTNQKPRVLDSANGRTWELDSKTDNGRSTEDYVLVCRLPHSKTGGFLLAGAGLTVYGTEEAGRILADPDALTPILRKLPGNWADENLELVLHVEVVGEAPAVPVLVAADTWK